MRSYGIEMLSKALASPCAAHLQFPVKVDRVDGLELHLNLFQPRLPLSRPRPACEGIERDDFSPQKMATPPLVDAGSDVVEGLKTQWIMIK